MHFTNRFRGNSVLDNQLVYGFGCYTDQSDNKFILVDDELGTMRPVEVKEIDMFTKEIKSIGADITIDMVKKCLSFLRKSEMISTSRSTRGVRIKVLKFDKYQDQKNYTGTSRSTKKALRKHEESTPIYNKEKKEKNRKYRTKINAS